jgi:hypothetical protein
MKTIDDALRVKWWYRANVKNPRDTVETIAKESGCSVATVRDGIAEAKRLLDMVEPMVEAGILQQDEDGRIRIVKQP